MLTYYTSYCLDFLGNNFISMKLKTNAHSVPIWFIEVFSDRLRVPFPNIYSGYK